MLGGLGVQHCLSNPGAGLRFSQELGYADEVRFLQIFKPRERSVEILRQIEHFLGHLDDVLLFGFRYLN